MCFLCHQNLDNETLIEQLNTPNKFEEWNTTSLSHLFIMALGYNGKEIKELALKNLDEFMVWYNSQMWDEYMPTNGLEAMYARVDIQNFIDFVRVTHYSKDELTDIFHNSGEVYGGLRDEIVKHMPKSTKKYFQLNNKNSMVPSKRVVVFYGGCIVLGGLMGYIMRTNNVNQYVGYRLVGLGALWAMYVDYFGGY